ncbi:MAG: tetratricopeptide repeat protein, partial [Rhodospirillales bacterium]|nr:tetratricopeptide repeat protein [Rhodospirillales bacterium]
MNFRNRATGRARRIAAGVACAAVALAVAGTAPAAADKAETVPGKTLTGNYLAGRHAQAQRDLGAAADFLGAALKQAPDAPDLLRRTFVLMTAEGRMREAQELAKRLLVAEPDEPVAALTLAVADIKRGRFAAAAELLAKLPKDGLSSLMTPVLKAWILVGEKKTDEALTLLAPGTGEKATLHLRALHAALIQEMAGRLDEAERHFKSVTDDRTGMSFRAVQLYGGLLERQGKKDEARALYDRYLKEQPGTPLLDMARRRIAGGAKPAPLVTSAADGTAEGLFDVASSLSQQNARETAMVLGRLALYLKPKFPVMQILLGDILEADNRLEPALAVYKAIDAKSTFSWSARLRAAAILDKLGRVDEAVKTLRTMAKEVPDDEGPLINLGDILRGHERFKEAAEAYDEAMKRIAAIEPRHWTLFYARGISLERSDQWPRAEADFQKALEFKPDQPYVLNYLGYTWIERGKNLEQAQEMIRQAVKLRPNDGYIVDSLGWG